MSFQPAIECLTECRDEAEANLVLEGMRIQVGFMSGRLLPPSAVSPKWRVQAFMETAGVTREDWLPDGMRWVLCPPALLAGD